MMALYIFCGAIVLAALIILGYSLWIAIKDTLDSRF